MTVIAQSHGHPGPRRPESGDMNALLDPGKSLTTRPPEPQMEDRAARPGQLPGSPCGLRGCRAPLKLRRSSHPCSPPTVQGRLALRPEAKEGPA